MTTTALSHKRIVLYGALALFIGAHFGLSLLAMPQAGSSSVALSSDTLRLLRLLVALLYWPTWFLGARGVLMIWEYAGRFRSEPSLRQRGFLRIGNGLLWLFASLATAAIVSSIRTRLGAASPFRDELTILLNYLYLLVPLLGIALLFSGARMLARSGSQVSRQTEKDKLRAALLFALVISGIYATLVFTNPNRQAGMDAAAMPTYYLSDPLIVLTILFPAFLMWLLGIAAAFQLGELLPARLSERQMRAQHTFVTGIWMILLFMAAIHVILALGGARLASLGLTFLLVAVYGVLLLLLAGCVLLLRGIRGLLRVPAEEVRDVQAGT